MKTITEAPANARLIPAPQTMFDRLAKLESINADLLAAARLAVEWAEQVPAPYRDWPHVAAARAAIAKARG